MASFGALLGLGQSAADGTTVGLTVAVQTGITFGVGVAFAMLDAPGAVSCADSRGTSYALTMDRAFSMPGGVVRFCTFLARSVLVTLLVGDQITITHPRVESSRCLMAVRMAGVNGGTAFGLNAAGGEEIAPGVYGFLVQGGVAPELVRVTLLGNPLLVLGVGEVSG